MTKLFKHDCKYHNYYTDDQGRYQGEYKRWDNNGQLREHCYYKDGNLHGECKYWHSNGQLEEHCFFKDNMYHGEYKEWWESGDTKNHIFHQDNKIITSEITKLVKDIKNITHKEKLIIKLTYGIECISKEITCHN